MIENRAIVELPLNGRNYLQLASLIPGATTNGPSSSQGKQRMGGQRNSFALNVAGQRIHFNHYSLDGVENTDLNFNSYMLLPSVDALEEFNIVSGLFDAEYGRAIAQVNVSTKSGSNKLRGTVFEFLRHSSLDAKNYFDRQDLSDPAVQAQPVRVHAQRSGGAAEDRRRPEQAVLHVQLGGAAREQVADADAVAAAHRLAHGRFLGPARRQRQPDPDLRPGDACVRRGRQRAAGADAVSRQSSSRRIAFIRCRRSCSPIFRCAQQQVTGPNFVNDEARHVNADQYTYRIDFTQGKSTWTFRHSISHELGYDPFPIPNMGSNTDTDVQQIVFSNTRTLASNKLNDVRFGFGYLKNGHISPRANNENVVKALGINLPIDNPLYWGVPNINITGLSGPRRGERRAVHQQRQDDSVRRQLHVDRRQAFVQVRRRAPARASTTRSAAS